jgi:hypothetical protein
LQPLSTPDWRGTNGLRTPQTMATPLRSYNHG